MPNDILDRLRAINELAGFNRWAGFVVVDATRDSVTLRMPWRDELSQYAGNLHAGLTSALIDTACGFAALATTGKPVVASHCAVSYLAPGTGPAFVATSRRGSDRSSSPPNSTTSEMTSWCSSRAAKRS